MSDTPSDGSSIDPLPDRPIVSAEGDAAGPSGLSMMITRRQRAALVALGFTDGDIRSMRPAEAHAHLGLLP